ncbi:MAG: hypothetical protein M3O55_10145 [Actinomycetota bacterium]|nr:hypothetical protein [Actinomycetota bacterium]
MYAAVFVGLMLGLYLLSCLFWPYKPCPTCKGGGKRRSPIGISWRMCTRCKGTGQVFRIGHRVIRGR